MTVLRSFSGLDPTQVNEGHLMLTFEIGTDTGEDQHTVDCVIPILQVDSVSLTRSRLDVPILAPAGHTQTPLICCRGNNAYTCTRIAF